MPNIDFDRIGPESKNIEDRGPNPMPFEKFMSAPRERLTNREMREIANQERENERMSKSQLAKDAGIDDLKDILQKMKQRVKSFGKLSKEDQAELDRIWDEFKKSAKEKP